MLNFFYYCFIYLFVFFVKFVKSRNTHSESKELFIKVINVPLDLTFAFSGCIIQLITNIEKEYIPIVTLGTVALFTFSAYMEYTKDLFGNIRCYINIIYILIIFGLTFYVFGFIIINKDNSINIKSYTVIIPYKNNTLIDNVGRKKIGYLNLIFSTTIKGSNKDSIIHAAIENFKSNPSIKPIFLNESKKYKIGDNFKLQFEEFIEYDTTKIMSFPNY